MENKKHIVILTGAGISAESGLKTFRDGDGLWMGYNIEDVATPNAFLKNPQLVLDFYNKRREDVAAAFPNAAHIGLAALEEKYKVTIVTQNIDDLHERAGSTNVVHLHGEIFKMFSLGSPHKIVEIRGDINLGVYPAAGLIHYVPLDIPKYIIDKKIPAVSSYPNLFIIEKSATEGVQELIGLLNK